MFKAVLLDVDGVLYDSMPLHAKAWQESFKKAGIRLPAKLVYQIEGTKDRKSAEGMLRALHKKLPNPIIESISAEKVRIYNTYSKPKQIKGVKVFIRNLQKAGIKICLVTGSSQIKTTERLKKDFGIQRSFIITGADVRHGKPHPEPYLMALKKLKIKARDAVVIENAPLGIISAKRAKIFCVAIKTGPLPKAELKKSGADKIVNNFEVLGKILKIH